MTYRIKHVGLAELSFEVGGTGEDKSSNVRFVVRDEKCSSDLGDFPHVVVPLLHTQPGETKSGLTSSA